MSSPRRQPHDDGPRPETAGQDVSEAGQDKEKALPAGQGGPSTEDAAATTGEEDRNQDASSHVPPGQAEAPQDGEEEEEIPYPEPEDEAPLLPPPDFKPFFTVIEDDNGEHHHPTVHYVFADDEDTEFLTNAALQTLSDSEQPRQDGEPENRFVILDLDPTGKEVISAVSLSPEWQALKTQTSPAPSWGGQDDKSTDRGLMLRISGQEAKREALVKGRAKGDVNGLLKMFDENMAGLDGVLGSSDKDTHETTHEGDEGAAG
ncbi:hypothetical protein M409DRAFT_17415 [Zasmidium cellare ATCC 36951]|uniref:Uncharacterized protein n=1 Tax=Zasmidium cellare ATCC 36951 TaxID=1080233 RepID=A0A6A6D3D4_ZASCE|nr:uncharacterized protein M409DRAFT_17415 [Zasmidium cellare ATCC 36951]KAF2172176.1 hypothetical protein M409DRAFT_17415 [Zasmidium cellare ATCC 36951]